MFCKRATVMGYYGRGNAGDEAMLWGILRYIRECLPGYEICVIAGPGVRFSGDEEVRRIPQGILSVVWSLFRSSLFVWGGGTFLHDFRGLKRYSRNLLLTLLMLVVAKIFGNRILLLGVGVGPVRTAWGRTLITLCVRLADVILTRDEDSHKIACRLRGSSKDVHNCFDLSILGLPMDESSCERPNQRPQCLRLGVSILPVQEIYNLGNDEALVDTIAKVMKNLAEKHTGLKATVFVFNSATDEALSKRLATRLMDQGIETTTVTYDGDPWGLYRSVESCDLMISMRYHAALYSVVSRTPQLVLAYHPKCEQLAAAVGYSGLELLRTTEWDADKLLSGLDSLIHGKSDVFAIQQLQDLRQKCQSTISEVLRTYGGDLKQSIRC